MVVKWRLHIKYNKSLFDNEHLCELIFGDKRNPRFDALFGTFVQGAPGTLANNINPACGLAKILRIYLKKHKNFFFKQTCVSETNELWRNGIFVYLEGTVNVSVYFHFSPGQ